MLTRWQRFGDWRGEMNRLHEDMSRLFDHLRLSGAPTNGGAAYPPMNMWGDENQLYVEAELPGLELDDLEMYVNGDNQLSIKGNLQPPAAAEGTWHRRERAYGEFTRVIELPGVVDSDKVSARLENGILTITLPKRAEGKPRRIEVKAGG